MASGEPICGITCTLRDAIDAARALTGTDTIAFADGLVGELTLIAPLSVDDDVTIEGPGANLLTLSIPGREANSRRVFLISGNSNVTLRGMTIQRAGDGEVRVKACPSFCPCFCPCGAACILGMDTL